MKQTKLLAIVLCVVSCIDTATSFAADDDFGIESAMPTVIADPVNPQPGMVFNAYSYDNWMKAEAMRESNTTLPKMAALKTGVDKNEKFGIQISDGVEAKAIRWEGFLKCKRAATYTFLFQEERYNGVLNGYSVKINGQPAIPSYWGETSCDVNLKVGWNKVEIVLEFINKKDLRISFKPKGSLAEPRVLAPKVFFYDQKPEEDW